MAVNILLCSNQSIACHVGMRGRNYGVCHSCRSTDHYFGHCKRKIRCPCCTIGIQKCFEVEKDGNNKGRLFKTCSNSCGFFEWVGTEESSEESSGVNEVMSNTDNEKVDNLSGMFERLARIAEIRNVEISMNITFRKGKEPSEDNGKGKEPA